MEYSRRAAKRARHRENAAARAAREEEKHRREIERHQQELEKQRRDLREQKRIEEAVVLGDKAAERMQRLEVVLRAALKRLPEQLDFEGMKKPLPDIDVGIDSEPFPLPQWEEYAPAQSGPLGKFLRGKQDARLREAEQAYARAMEQYRIAEEKRRRELDRAHGSGAGLTPEQWEIRRHNERIDEFRTRVFEGDRYAVTDYFKRALAPVKEKKVPLPETRRIAYVSDSKLLLLDWDVAGTDIIPREKSYRYNKETDSIEVARWRSVGTVRELYHNLLAQLALRGIAATFSADPNWVVETVVFNARLEDGTCVFSTRATRHQFERISLDDLTDTMPLEQVQKRFATVISPFPGEGAEVTPLLPYELAEPSAASSGDEERDACRIDLNALSTHEFDGLMEQLMTQLGYSVEVIRPEDEDCDILATRDTPDGQERLLVHVRRVAHTAGLNDAKALARALRREGANRGMLLITGGFDTRAYDYAAHKPIQMYDRHALLALLHQHQLTKSTVCQDEDGANGLACATHLPVQREAVHAGRDIDPDGDEGTTRQPRSGVH